LEGHLQPQPAVCVGFLGADGQRGAQQVLPPRRVHPYQHGDLVAAGQKLRAAFPPDPVQIDPVWSLCRFGEFRGG